ncbi:hypothetical protein BT96DRAFT_997360 [Gymnopus androsaceus JB14]|uniref:Uncharacterized protein n=1 Tax=Gymnopus androsaceus JB14 TaxID=1447944 RepID=A0A6A4HBS9_9AGAR|nr:hypothetical protein BT96DRAFT_997360 [Gymnopus androsaceus JB14]
MLIPFIDNEAQLENRHHNAALLHYVDSVRIHGHRAARIDPLDLIPRDSEVAALDPSRYGPKDGNKRYNNGGLQTRSPHLRDIHVGRIAYEYMHSQSKTERLWFSHLESNTMPLAVDKQLKQRIHGLLARSKVFDNFLQLKFPNLKRDSPGYLRDVLERVEKACARGIRKPSKVAEICEGASAEAMAFGIFLLEGNDVLISGQDVGRRTFSQHHAMLVDQMDERTVTVPIRCGRRLADQHIWIGSLSEMAVLGFEYGTSWERSTLLLILEALFGDFFDVAQLVGYEMVEAEWTRNASPSWSQWCLSGTFFVEIGEVPSGMMVLNPSISFPTTPAQYFYPLRRQMSRNYRKPLVVATPKGLLRLSVAASLLADLEPGTSFKPILRDHLENESTSKRIVIISGKIYYDLVRTQRAWASRCRVVCEMGGTGPVPVPGAQKCLGMYTEAALERDVVYLQEEPRNQVALPADFSVWAASPEASWLHGRFLWAHWDVDELKADSKMLKQFEDESGFMKVARVLGLKAVNFEALAKGN